MKAKPPELRVIALDLLDPHPDQPRGKVGDVTELAASIREVGVLQPIVVVVNGDRYTIIAGHRRKAGAKKAGLTEIPTVVFPSDAPAQQFAALMAENTQRENLSPTEEARGLQTALALGITAETIEKATGRKVDVEGVGRVVKQAKKLGKDLEGRHASLEETAAIADFAGDQTWYDHLVRNAGTPHFAHILQRARDDRESKRKRAEVEAKLKKDGVRIIDWNIGWRGNSQQLSKMTVEGEKLTPAKHKDCEGHAAIVEGDGKVVYFCTKANLHGYGQPDNGQKSEADKELDRRKRTSRKDHKSAAAVRHEHLTGMCSGVLAAHLVSDRPTRVLNTDKANDIAIEFVAAEAADEGLPQLCSTYDVASKIATGFVCDRSTAVQKLLGLAAGNVEKYLADSVKASGALNPATSDRERYARYFTMLQAFGYTLADCEAALAGRPGLLGVLERAGVLDDPAQDIRVESAEPTDDEPEAIETVD